MAHDVFISYSHHDKPAADAACSTLEAAGIRCWIAPRDIWPGAEWGEAIVEAIDHSRILALVFSSNANGSVQVRREVERAVHKEVTIIPVRIEPTEPSRSLAYFMAGVHWLGALTPPLEHHLQRLAGSIKALLQTSPHNPADGIQNTTHSDDSPKRSLRRRRRITPRQQRGDSEVIQRDSSERQLALLSQRMTALKASRTEIPWSDEARHFGLEHGVLEEHPDHPIWFTKGFIMVLGKRAVQRPPENETEFRSTFWLAILDISPTKISVDDLAQFVTAVYPQLTELLASIGISNHIFLPEGDGIVLSPVIKSAVVEDLIARDFESFEDLYHYLLDVLRIMAASRLMHDKVNADLWPLIAYTSFLVLGGRDVLKTMWDRVFSSEKPVAT